jgi:hypothetical protein
MTATNRTDGLSPAPGARVMTDNGTLCLLRPRTEEPGYYGELGQSGSGLHGDRPECIEGSTNRGGRSRGDRARRAPGAWTEWKVPGNRR